MASEFMGTEILELDTTHPRSAELVGFRHWVSGYEYCTSGGKTILHREFEASWVWLRLMETVNV